MKSKPAAIIALIVSILFAILKNGCGDTGKIAEQIKVVAPALVDTVWLTAEPIHDTVTQYRVTYRTAPCDLSPDQLLALAEGRQTQTEADTVWAALPPDTQTKVVDPFTAGIVPENDVFEDSVEGTWGVAHIQVLLNRGEVLAINATVDPTPCPPSVDTDAVTNKAWSDAVRSVFGYSGKNYVGLNAGWSFTSRSPVLGLHFGHGPIGAQINVNNIPKIESIGLAITKSF